MVKTVCFDLDGVYFTARGKKSFHTSLVALSDNEPKVNHALGKSAEMLDFVTGKIPPHTFWNYVRQYLKIELSDTELGLLWVKEYEVDQAVRELVLKVRSLGIKTAICSNNNPVRVSLLESKFGFLSDFDVRIFSYQVGFVKPSTEIFTALIKSSESLPHQIIYSDDNTDRLIGAAGLGIKTFVYHDIEGFVTELKALGVPL